MPTYDYECQECGYTFEHFQMMSDPPLTECPECGGKIKRLIGGGLGVIFKGSGFYVTDNKSAKPPGLSNHGDTKKSADTEKTDSAAKEPPAPKKEEPVKT